jgi:hypothetical protein
MLCGCLFDGLCEIHKVFLRRGELLAVVVVCVALDGGECEGVSVGG